MKKNAYPHEVNKIELIETHISWIVLTGKYAYKIKKAINLDYVKAKDIDQRIKFCNEEIRLNRRLASELYIGISRITGSVNNPKVEDTSVRELKSGIEDSIDIAIKMNQFPASSLLKNQLRLGRSNTESIIRLAIDVAKFHLSTEQAVKMNKLELFNNIIRPVEKNIAALSELPLDKNQSKNLKLQIEIKDANKKHIYKKFKERINCHAIRECHGDLHTGNIYLNKMNRLVVFDAIDFKPELRWIDPISEIAFLAIDLEVNSGKKNKITLLNKWLEITGDYFALDQMQWYSAYRSLVRAKVSGLKLSQIIKELGHEKSKNEIILINKEIDSYLAHANNINNEKSNGLILMHGLSGSGKSYISNLLCRKLNAIRVRSDIERKRLLGFLPILCEGYSLVFLQGKRSLSRFKDDPYNIEVTNYLFKRWLPSIAEICIKNGHTIILDATFLREEERAIMKKISKKLMVPYAIIDCRCSDSTAEERISQRASEQFDPSEADNNIRNLQKHWQELLTIEEQRFSIAIDERINLTHLTKDLLKLLSNQNEHDANG